MSHYEHFVSALEASDLPAAAWSTLLTLLRRCDDNLIVKAAETPTEAVLAALTGQSERTIRTQLKLLEEKEWVSRWYPPGHRSAGRNGYRYQLAIPIQGYEVKTRRTVTKPLYSDTSFEEAVSQFSAQYKLPTDQMRRVIVSILSKAKKPITDASLYSYINTSLARDAKLPATKREYLVGWRPFEAVDEIRPAAEIRNAASQNVVAIDMVRNRRRA